MSFIWPRPSYRFCPSPKFVQPLNQPQNQPQIKTNFGTWDGLLHAYVCYSSKRGLEQEAFAKIKEEVKEMGNRAWECGFVFFKGKGHSWF